ncbi:hypothetical protein [Endozoicomonas sp. YOMI1]|uniref:hypothetical protein n=1 Tax=Endozoicomonas sp. YOMI1 TaxID=2828739 RepID=UPI0021478686|nr:hypothetical protein [Endozoicomonas sp. YOMI1]
MDGISILEKLAGLYPDNPQVIIHRGCAYFSLTVQAINEEISHATLLSQAIQDAEKGRKLARNHASLSLSAHLARLNGDISRASRYWSEAGSSAAPSAKLFEQWRVDEHKALSRLKSQLLI